MPYNPSEWIIVEPEDNLVARLKPWADVVRVQGKPGPDDCEETESEPSREYRTTSASGMQVFESAGRGGFGGNV